VVWRVAVRIQVALVGREAEQVVAAGETGAAIEAVAAQGRQPVGAVRQERLVLHPVEQPVEFEETYLVLAELARVRRDP